MADNITLNAGCGGSVLATDCITCVHYQIEKLAFGALNTATLVTACAGLPVDLKASVGLTVDLGCNNDVTTELGCAITVSGDCQAAVATAPVWSFGLGFDGTNWARVRTGTDGVLQVDLAQDSLAGNLDINLAASAATVTVTGDSCGSLTVDNAALSVTGGGVEACALRVTIANNSTGVLSVDDNGAALTVDACQLDIDSLCRACDNVGAALLTNAIMCAGTALTPKFANITADATCNTLVTGVACKKIRVLQLFVVSAGAVNAYIQDTGACPTDHVGDASHLIELTCSSGFVLPFSPVGWFETTAGDGVELVLSAACVDVAGALTYVEV